MHDSYTDYPIPGRHAGIGAADSDDSRVEPSASRMLTNYLADVEQNLDEHRWELALRDVIDLPRIAVALASPEMHSSAAQCRTWCARWVRPSNAANDYSIDHEFICRVLDQQSDQPNPEPEKPSVALRRLRLRRHARNAPRGFNAGRLSADRSSAETFAVCTAVVEAVRRWYGQEACHDATAQANLARLAVLR